jgi:hypothetical protein
MGLDTIFLYLRGSGRLDQADWPYVTSEQSARFGSQALFLTSMLHVGRPARSVGGVDVYFNRFLSEETGF